MAKPKHTFERAYFIGAGLSAGMHYPIGRELMPRLLGYLRGDKQAALLEQYGFTNSVHGTPGGPEEAERLIRVIRSVLRKYFAADVATIERIDVAEFFSMAHTLSESPWLLDPQSLRGGGRSAAGSPSDLPSELTLFADLAAVTRSYFNDIGEMFLAPPDIRSVLHGLRPERDVVINFNWDEEVDFELTANTPDDIAYTLGEWEKEGGILLLKPHGSIGWYDVQQGIGNKQMYFIAGFDARLPRSQKRILAYPANVLPIDIDGTKYSPLSCPPVITAPTFSKRFDYVEQHRIWQDVLEVCQGAREFVFLGYSLPRDDFLTRAAIRRAIEANRARRRLKCLVVDLSFDDAMYLNFLTVFEGLSPKRNHLQWRFGSDADDLMDRLETALRRATTTG